MYINLNRVFLQMQIEKEIPKIESFLEQKAFKSVKAIVEAVPKMDIARDLRFVNKSKTMPTSHRLEYVRTSTLNTDYNRVANIANNDWQIVTGYGSNILENPVMNFSVLDGTNSSGGLVKDFVNDPIYYRKPIQEQKVNIITKYKNESNGFYLENLNYFEDCKKCFDLCHDRRNSRINAKVNFICNTCIPKCTLKNNNYI